MKLSLITVNYNNVDGLRKTIESVLSQTFNDFEWIVIDGGSTDGSRELLERNASHFSYWVSEKDGGIYNAMNKGVRRASGEYVQFLNSGDSFVDERVLEDVFKMDYDGALVYGDIILTKDGHQLRTQKYDELSFCFLLHSTINHQASFIPRQMLVDCPYDEKYRISSDWDFLLKMAIDNCTFRHIDRTICFYDMGGVSSVSPDLLAEERMDIVNRLVPGIVQKDYSEGRISELIMLRKKYPVFGKLVTALVLVMARIDRSLSKKL